MFLFGLLIFAVPPLIIFMIIFQLALWENSFLSLDQFKEHINLIRGVNAVNAVSN
jgi:hypothetical protein